VRRTLRGGAGDYATRMARADDLLESATGVVRDPLRLMRVVLDYQAPRFDEPRPPALARSGDYGPLLDASQAAEDIVAELPVAIAAVRPAATAPLGAAADTLLGMAPSEIAACVETWLDDLALVEARLGFWLNAAAGPVLERAAAAAVVAEDWSGGACPVCGGPAHVSVIAEESGEFMAGSPRSLICGRCATAWRFSRARCTVCGEDDSTALSSYCVERRRVARVDTCSTCRAYIKTFDLRQDGARDVVPLVDDVATLTLDVWAREQGYSRPTRSPAGV
jgi:formate dehydrogenase accessory protein FdhE